jgi:hypothetical protein
VARGFDASRIARPSLRTCIDPDLLSTPHLPGFARRLPHFVEKGARNRLMFDLPIAPVPPRFRALARLPILDTRATVTAFLIPGPTAGRRPIGEFPGAHRIFPQAKITGRFPDVHASIWRLGFKYAETLNVRRLMETAGDSFLK